MKVALITFHSFFEEGGVKRHILALKEEFKNKNVATKVIVPRRKISEKYGEDVILLGTSFKLNLGGGISDLVFNFDQFAIERALKKEKFDILHFHNASFPSFFQILLSPYTFKTLNILTFHSDISRSNFLKTIFPFFITFCNQRLDGLIAVSDVALSFFNDFKKPKILIPNGVNLNEFSPEGEKFQEFLDEKINLLFVGRIEERKGLIYLLKAFRILKRKYNNLRLIVVGDGPEKENCQNFVKEKKLQDVVFLGELKGESLFKIYRTGHIFCAPSIFGESFGLVILEAMASGLPFAGFANEGYKSWLKGKKGEYFLAPPKDFIALAKRIEVLIKYPEKRKELADWGYKEAKKYSWERIAQKVLEFYQNCQKLKEKNNKKFLPEERYKNEERSFGH
jgi:phosphatidylinositol alpha-mannosyltransferase